MKRVLTIGDLHCGAVTGLTPPGWIANIKGREKVAELQLKAWQFYDEVINSLGKIDVLIVNGDLVDGKGARAGGVECEQDLNRQVEMAVDCINHIDAKKIIIIRGTPYHVVSEGIALEDNIAQELGAHVGGHEWVDVNGLIFDCKHKVGGSSVPHGRATAIKREALWNLLWSETGTNEKADIILRSHVHYHEYTGNPQYLAMTLPALQLPGSKYGVEQCSGVVDFGLVHFDVDEKGGYSWQSHLMPVAVKQTPIKA